MRGKIWWTASMCLTRSSIMGELIRLRLVVERVVHPFFLFHCKGRDRFHPMLNGSPWLSPGTVQRVFRYDQWVKRSLLSRFSEKVWASNSSKFSRGSLGIKLIEVFTRKFGDEDRLSFLFILSVRKLRHETASKGFRHRSLKWGKETYLLKEEVISAGWNLRDW
jgi:hypothetical protein